MKKRFAALLCLWLLVAQTAHAETGIGTLAETREGDARLLGFEVYDQTSFAWGNLPLVDAETNGALKSLASALRFERRAQGARDAGYVSFDMILQNVSVLDFSLLTRGGVYYEQSNLLGGKTAACTKEEFADFVGRVSAKSGGALPGNLDILFDLARLGIGGGNVTVDTATVNAVVQTFGAWSKTALTQTERLHPKSMLPGVYGVRASVTQITRAEALKLAQTVTDLLSGDEALIRAAAAEQLPGGGENALRQAVKQATDTLRALPDALESAIPQSLPPAEYREVFDASGALTAVQVDAVLPGDLRAYVEWQPSEQGPAAVYASLASGDSALTLLVSFERGKPETVGAVFRRRDGVVSELTLSDPALHASLVTSTVRNAERQGDKETVRTRTDWTLESPELVGGNTALTLTAQTTDTASGAAAAYKRNRTTEWAIGGLGGKSEPVLTMTTDTEIRAQNAPINPDDDVVRLGSLDEKAFDAFLRSVELGATQVGYTIMGRVPPDVATFVLSRFFGQTTGK